MAYQLRADTQLGSLLFGLVDALDDSIRVPLEIQRPLVEVARAERDKLHRAGEFQISCS